MLVFEQSLDECSLHISHTFERVPIGSFIVQPLDDLLQFRASILPRNALAIHIHRVLSFFLKGFCHLEFLNRPGPSLGFEKEYRHFAFPQPAIQKLLRVCFPITSRIDILTPDQLDDHMVMKEQILDISTGKILAQLVPLFLQLSNGRGQKDSNNTKMGHKETIILVTIRLFTTGSRIIAR